MRSVGDIALDAEVRAIASGAITDGAPVIVNANGTVSLAGTQSSAVGASVNLTSGGSKTSYTSVAYDSNSNRYLIAFVDEGNSDYGTAVVASVSGTTVTLGTPAVFENAETNDFGIAFDSNANKFLIVYRDNGNSNYGTGVVATIDNSDNSVSFGTPAVFESATAQYMGIDFDSNVNKFVIAYRDGGNSGYATAVVGTISGTNVSFGTPVVFNTSSNFTDPTPVTFDSSNNKVLISYRDAGNSNYGTSIVGTISGTGISFGSEAVFESANSSEMGSVFDSSNNKVVIAYRDTGNSNYGTAVVATISSTSVSFGSPVVFNSAASDYFSLAFSTQLNKTLITYQDGGTVVSGILGTVSGTSISFGSEISLSGASSGSTSSGQRIDSNVAFNTTDNNFAIVSSAADGSSSGQVFAHTSEFNPLTSENFIGFAHAAYADGQKATVKTTGSIARNIPQVASASSTLGTEVQFESAEVTQVSSTYDSTNNRIVVSYSDVGSSNDGTIAVGTVNASDNSISFGTPVHYNSNVAITNNDVIHDSNSNKIVVSYTDADNSHYGTAIVGTIDTSDNSISFGSPTVYESASTNSSSTNGITFDSNSNKVVIIYRDVGNSNYGTAIVGTVSGTSISFGSAVVFESAFSIHMGATFDSSNNKVVIAYRDVGNSDYGTAIVGTVSGTSISFGSPVVYESAESDYNSIAFDSSNNKVVISYKDKGNSSYGTAIVGTVSGTSISFGTPVVYESASVSYTSITFDSNINKVIIAYEDDGNSEYGTFVIGTVSGTSISFGTPAVFNAGEILYSTINFDSNSKRSVICYEDVGNSQYGTAIALTPAGTPEDLTIGQQYFVQTDGTLDTSADDPSVIAGTAIGASDIVVKG